MLKIHGTDKYPCDARCAPDWSFWEDVWAQYDEMGAVPVPGADEQLVRVVEAYMGTVPEGQCVSIRGLVRSHMRSFQNRQVEVHAALVGLGFRSKSINGDVGWYDVSSPADVVYS